jgi:hypothetical protein
MGAGGGFVAGHASVNSRLNAMGFALTQPDIPTIENHRLRRSAASRIRVPMGRAPTFRGAIDADKTSSLNKGLSGRWGG